MFKPQNGDAILEGDLKALVSTQTLSSTEGGEAIERGEAESILGETDVV